MEYSSITTNNSLGSTTGDGVGTDFEPQELRSSTSEPKPQDVSELALIIFSAVLFGLGFIVSLLSTSSKTTAEFHYII